MAMTLVLGVGNTLLGDDGAGVHVALRLRELISSRDVRILDAGTLGFALLSDVQDCSALIVIDAARDELAPGSVSVREGEAMDAFLRRRGRTVHEVGVADLIDMARLSGRLPERRALVGIEPESVDWDVECSPAVVNAVPLAAARTLDLINRWRSAAAQGPVEHVA